MKTAQKIALILLIGLLFIRTTSGQPTPEKDILLLFADTIMYEYGYVNEKGDTIIPLGKYALCYTDTFETFAIVSIPIERFVAIDRQENILYKVFAYDNGPDEASEGLFRIVVDSQIGYADALTGKIIIQPQFDCAWPFENGIDKVATDCITKTNGEYSTWNSEKWYYIDKTGKTVSQPKQK